jgi:hypothetical protein
MILRSLHDVQVYDREETERRMFVDRALSFRPAPQPKEVRRYWTKEEVELLMARMDEGSKALSKVLGRSQTAVIAKKWRIRH